MLSKRTRVLIIAGSWVLVSQLQFYFAHAYFVAQIPPDILKELPYAAGYTQLAYTLMSLFGGLAFGYIVVYRKIKMRTFSSGIWQMTGLFILVFLSSLLLVTALISLHADGLKGLSQLPKVLWGVLSNPGTLMSVLFWAVVVAATQFVLEVSDKFGQGVLWKFITGRYFHPREEERIFMFLDMKSSTTIAEQTGHLKFFELLRDVFGDITQAIVDHQGEIYQYVGDEVVISWTMANGLKKAQCIHCFLGIQKRLQELAPAYRQNYGVQPTFKAGIHHGKVTVGEIGIIKKDIVFSGDVLNTTARIQSLCNNYRAGLLISGDTLALLPNEGALSFVPLGEIELRGKEQLVPIFALEQSRYEQA